MAGSGERRDAALPMLTVRQAGRVRALVREALARQGRRVTVFPGHIEDADGAKFGLGGIARVLTARAIPEPRWGTLVDAHVARMLSAMAGPDDFRAPTEELLPRTYFGLYDRTALPGTGGWGYAREALPDVLEVFVLDCPDSVKTYCGDEVARHGEHRLRAAALANARREDPGERRDFDGVHLLCSESMHFASSALVLPELVLKVTGEAPSANGVLVAVPFRHQVLYSVPRDERAGRSLEAMTKIAAAEYRTGTGPISPHVFWWRDGRFTRLTEGAPGETPRLAVPAEFEAVLDSLVRNGS
ncbi:hypothetical protein [Amycolatopsis sp. CA-230715]|uniref:hypothetical protein n=1 Tax=Amycolatopsis sp. CA-230715 TaxID=2745196 RepID=UPI001C033051|nr:hypothetical protein [Amycolatopsis sp. CA-230715]QWF79204.1 hypothetical protein HUW46_02611 [Amycolatopsis sp. CA-230715]